MHYSLKYFQNLCIENVWDDFEQKKKNNTDKTKPYAVM